MEVTQRRHHLMMPPFQNETSRPTKSGEKSTEGLRHCWGREPLSLPPLSELLVLDILGLT